MTRPPFADFAPPVRVQTPLRAPITAAYRRPEAECLAPLLDAASLPEPIARAATATATSLVTALRAKHKGTGVEGLVQEYALSSQEGVALMCLAEALLRIPDTATRDALIRDKIAGGDWRAHVGDGRSLFVNAATWGLVVTGKLTGSVNDSGLGAALTRLIARAGEPVIRRGVDMAMRMMGEQFVTGETIGEALKRARPLEARGFRYSYDMLGEAATTAADADRYYCDYENAVRAIGEASAGRGIFDGPGISIKLSALHPRYVRAQAARVMAELLPRVKALAVIAKGYDIGFNIDAEEADRLELSLDLLESLATDPDLAGWNGLGFVVQAYGKRCPFVIDWIVDLARRANRRIMVRLVKGAYWDAEIKRAQVDGLADFPVYTRKIHTDVAYIACARKLLAARDAVFPQFATHNAQTLGTIYHLAGSDFTVGDYEFQCLHGMGEPLYDEVVGPDKLNRPCRIYAPVGTHETLLAYLVRRLLENGANSSFVEARVQAEGEAVAGGVDPVDQPIQLRAAEADDVQDRAEHLALQLGNVGQFDDRRRDERAVRGIADERELFDAVAAGPHLCDVLVDIVLRLRGDDRADIGRQGVGAADRQLMQRALDHRERAVGDLLLQAQDAQRRTALPCAVEGGGDDVRHHLFGERGRIDDHRILPAGFGDERDRRSVGQQALGQLLLDQPGDLGRSGEHHRHRLGRGDQRGADRTVTGDEL